MLFLVRLFPVMLPPVMMVRLLMGNKEAAMMVRSDVEWMGC